MELKLKEITISRGATINKGNYENERVDVSMTALVHPEQSHSLVLNDLRAAVEMALKAEVVRTLDSIGEAGYWKREGWDARFGIVAKEKPAAPPVPADFDPQLDDGFDDDDDDWDEDDEEEDDEPAFDDESESYSEFYRNGGKSDKSGDDTEADEDAPRGSVEIEIDESGDVYITAGAKEVLEAVAEAVKTAKPEGDDAPFAL